MKERDFRAIRLAELHRDISELMDLCRKPGELSAAMERYATRKQVSLAVVLEVQQAEALRKRQERARAMGRWSDAG